ncbi:MAG: DUF1192 domain-containing protein [Sphingobium sp.]
MDTEDNLPRRADDPLRQVMLQDLDPLSVTELEERVAALETEIARTKEKIQFSVNHKASAEALFRK